MSRLIPIAEWTGEKRGNVVFVHGLNGHPTTTWQYDGRDTYWPLWIARDLPGMSVQSLGYLAPIAGYVGTSLSLVEQIRNTASILLNSSRLKTGPIAFVCHSQGGLIVKGVLCFMKVRSATEPAMADFLARTKQVIFLSTPHTGSEQATTLVRLAWLLQTTVAVRDLQANRPEQHTLNEDYLQLVEERPDLRHIIYYEKLLTWLWRVVDERSARAGLPRCTPIGVLKDHKDISKPQHREDEIYIGARNLIDTLAPIPTAVGALVVANEETFEVRRSVREYAPLALRLVALAVFAWLAYAGYQRYMVWREGALGRPEAIAAAVKTLLAKNDPLAQAAIDILDREPKANPTDVASAKRALDVVLQEGQRVVDVSRSAGEKSAGYALRLAQLEQETNAAKAEKYYREAMKLDPSNLDIRTGLAETLKKSGDIEAASDIYREGIQHAFRDARPDPNDPELQYKLAQNRVRFIGLSNVNRISIEEVRQAELALSAAEQFVVTDSEAKRGRWLKVALGAQITIGDYAYVQTEYPRGASSYLDAIQRGRKLLASEGISAADKSNVLRNIMTARQRLVQLYRGAARGTKDEAQRARYWRQAHDELNAMFTELDRALDAEPNSEPWLMQKALVHEWQGDIHLDDQSRAAREHYEKSLQLRRQLLEKNSTDKDRRRAVSTSLEKIGDVHRRVNVDYGAALSAYRESLSIREELLSSDQTNAELSRFVFVSRTKVAQAYEGIPHLKGALEYFQGAVAMARQRLQVAIERQDGAAVANLKSEVARALRREVEVALKLKRPEAASRLDEALIYARDAVRLAPTAAAQDELKKSEALKRELQGSLSP